MDDQSKIMKERWEDPDYRKDTVNKFKASWTEERRQKQSERMHWKMVNDQEYRDKIIFASRRPKSPETKQKMSEAAKGKSKSLDHREAMSRAQRLRGHIVRSIMDEQACDRKEALRLLREDKQFYYNKYGSVFE